MLQVEMSASARNVTGKGPMRQLRMKGITPAVVYGGGAEAMKIQLETKSAMAQLLDFYRKNALVTLKIDGEAEKKVLVGEVQTDPVKDTLIHIDFCEIDIKKVRAFNVPVVLKGTPKGVDLGGRLNHIVTEVVLEGKPVDIPEECVIDVSEMMIGDSVRCRRFVIPEGVTMLTDRKAVAVSVLKPGAKIEDDDDEDDDDVAVAAEGEAGAEAEAEAATE